MYISLRSISIFLLLVCVSAVVSEQPLDPRRASAIVAPQRRLDRRQVGIGSVSSAPSQCASSCTPVNDEVNLGCPVTACCTTTFETQYYNCLECVGAALDAGNYSTLQTSLNLLYMTCVDMGFVLPRLELPGQSNSSNATATAQPVSTGSGSGASSTQSPSTSSGATSARQHALWAEAMIGLSALLLVAALW